MQSCPSPRFSYLDAFYASFFSRHLYRDILERWQGMGFGYLFLLTLTTVAITAFSTLHRTQDFILAPQAETGISRLQQTGYIIAEQIPLLHWKQDRLTSEAPMPHNINFTIDGEDIAVIITDTQDNEELFIAGNALLMVGSQQLLWRTEAGIERFTYADSPALTELLTQHPRIDGSAIMQLTDEIQALAEGQRMTNLIVLGLIFTAFFSVIWIILRVILILLLALPFLLIAKALQRNIAFEEATRLLCIAITPAAFLHLALSLLFPHPLLPFMPGTGMPSLLYCALILFVAAVGFASAREKSAL